MRRLVWAQRALAELERLHHALAERDRDGARRTVRAIREGTRLIEAHPEAGRPVDGMDPEFRERWIAFGRSGYLAFYRLDESRVVVLAVRHGRELGF